MKKDLHAQLQQIEAYRETGDLEEALKQTAAALQTAKQQDNPASIAAIYMIQGEISEAVGDIMAALSSYRFASQIYTKIDNKPEMANSAGNCGRMARLLGQPEESLHYLNQALTIHRVYEQVDRKDKK